MRTVVVRYKTTEEYADQNAALIHGVFDELRAKALLGVRYVTYRLNDGVTFVHVATIDAADENPITALPAFKKFQQELKSRCVEAPVVSEGSIVDAYGALPVVG